jgi:ElaB/YqjD/DUF883 family membrane-anchored ribosome-binding protein
LLEQQIQHNRLLWGAQEREADRKLAWENREADRVDRRAMFEEGLLRDVERDKLRADERMEDLRWRGETRMRDIARDEATTAWRGLDAGTHEWTDRHDKEWTSLQAEIDSIRGKGMTSRGEPLAPEDQERAIVQLQEQQNKILPSPRPPMVGPALAERVESSIYTDPKTGKRYQEVPGKGIVEMEDKTATAAATQAQKDQQKMLDDVNKMMAETVTEKDGENMVVKQKYETVEEAVKALEERRAAVEKYFQPPAAGAPTSGEAAPAAPVEAGGKVGTAGYAEQPGMTGSPRAAVPVTPTPVAAAEAPGAAAPTVVNAPSPRAAELATQYLPRASTPEEATKLPSGTLFIDDKGVIRQVP